MTSVENAVAKAPETVFYDKGTLIDLVQTGGQPMKSFMLVQQQLRENGT